MEKKAALAQIRSNIERHGFHVYVVQQSNVPRFAYTIGLGPQIGFELLLAGAIFYMADEVVDILNTIGSQLRQEPARRGFDVNDLGNFLLCDVEDSWSRSLLLGAMDYYQKDVIAALQVVPQGDRVTIDVPNCSNARTSNTQPIWQWLDKPWQFPVPATSTSVTDLSSLRGAAIIEAARWEEDQWELFSGPGDQFRPDEVRIVPLGTLLAFDESLVPVTALAVGDGIYREDSQGEWNEW